jgi:hypothetical protein
VRRMTRGGRSRAALVLVGTLGALVSAARAQDLKRPEEQLAAIYALRTQLDVEQRRLDAALQRHLENARARQEAAQRTGRLYDDLDDMVAGRAAADAEGIRSKEQEVARADIELQALVSEGREIRREIRDTRERIDLLQDRIGKLRKSLPSDNEALTGTWDVTFTPSGDKGLFTLRQSGTILAGEYNLEGGWRGSLQGTLVDGKVHLSRIDAKLGRSSDLEGTVAPDGRTIRGNWTNFILSGGEPVTGSWVARKRSERPDSGAP